MADNKCNTADCGGNCDSCNGDITVTLTLDNDETVECAILTIFPVDGRDYIALLPLDENGENEDGEVYLYRYDNSTGSPVLDNIESDEEYDAVADMFDQMLDAAEYDELVEADGEDIDIDENVNGEEYTDINTDDIFGGLGDEETDEYDEDEFDEEAAEDEFEEEE